MKAKTVARIKALEEAVSMKRDPITEITVQFVRPDGSNANRITRRKIDGHWNEIHEFAGDQT